jgi:S-adenosylmethionine decarboxylase
VEGADSYINATFAQIWLGEEHEVPKDGEHKVAAGVAAGDVVGGDVVGGDVTVGPDYFIDKDGFRYAGGHLLLDFWGASNLTDPERVETALCDAARASGATILHAHLHQFGEGGGVSGVVVLAESHISIHTWPERSFAAVDIFMCGACDPHLAVPVLRRAFEPATMTLTEHRRGLVE